MATKYANVLGINWLREGINGRGDAVALVTFTMPAYTGGSDNGQLGGGGTLRGASTSDTLVAMLQNSRRDGKTVALKPTSQLGGCAESGKHGSTSYFAGTLAKSTSNATFNIEDASGAEIDAASGVTDQAIAVEINVTLT